MAENKTSKSSEDQGDEDYDPAEDPRVIQAENDAEELNKQSEAAAAQDEIWNEQKEAAKEAQDKAGKEAAKAQKADDKK